MADSGEAGGQDDTPERHNPFKLAAGPPSSVNLVFSSANQSCINTQSSDSPNYMLFGGKPTMTKPSTISSSSIFGAVTSVPENILLKPRITVSLSSGQEESFGTSAISVPSSSEKSQFGTVTSLFSSAISGKSGNVFGGSSTSTASQSIFSVQRPVFSPSGQAATMLFGDKTNASLPTKSFGDATTASPVLVPGQEKKNPFSVKSDLIIFPQSSNSKDIKPSPTPLLFGGIASTSVNQVSAAQNVFGGTSSQLFQGMKDPSIERGQDPMLKTSSEEIDAIIASETLPEKTSEYSHKTESSEMGSPPQYDKKEITKIIIAQIPDSCMDKEILRNHFMKFGNVKRVTLSLKANQALVQYENHHSASNAKKKGKKIHPKLPDVKIFYGSPVRRRSEDETALQSKKKAIKTLHLAQAPIDDLEPYIPIPRPTKETSGLPKHVESKISQTKKKQAGDVKKPEKIKKQQTRGGASGKEKKEASLPNEGKDSKEILLSKCNTSQDKYYVLQARDNLVRKEVIRTSDIEKATYLSAVCPDMCPEKERYMRDLQNDLSSYEMRNGVIDQALVVKKFSRSSADKDEPLPYELRPGPVLMMTMNFLVCNIIERGDDENVEMDVWYNYLWNRTRAIRNDLMQQQLTDEVAVKIIERCMRFHIHASARFSHEPPDLFDAKMNTEHLTKSLQTLKELYKDLGERGEYFDTEPEFRAYEFLLNLNQGETIMTQYSQYRDEVQKSNEVQFALKVGMAVMFNNYVKFFKLIRNATYLQACMMHRYFKQVRLKALDTLMKAYAPPKQMQSLPLETVIKTLGFEDEDDAKNYLQTYGITVVENNVNFDKNLFTLHPEELPPVVRPVKLVESNRSCSVGEVIQGGSLPENPLLTYVPHNSFDSQGYLKQEAKNASDQQTGNKLLMEQTEEVIQPNQRLLNKELQLYSYNLIEKGVIKVMINEVCKEAKDEYQVEYVKGIKMFATEILENYLEEEINTITAIAIQDVEKEEENMRKQVEKERKCKALKEMTNQVVHLLSGEYLNEFIDKSAKELCFEIIQEEEKQTWEAVIKELSLKLPVTILREVMPNEVENLIKEVIEEMRNELETKIIALQKKILSRKMQNYFKRWRLQVMRVKRRKEAQETFPASSSQLSIKHQNELFGWGYHRNKGNNISAFEISALEMSVSKSIEEKTVRNQLVKARAWQKLPLREEMKKEIDGSLLPTNLFRQFFRILICTWENTNIEISHWLRSKLRSHQENNINQNLNNFFTFITRNAGQYACLISEVSINSLTSEDMGGVSALIFVMPSQARNHEVNNRALRLLKTASNLPKLTIQYDKESCEAVAEGIFDSTSWKLAECDLYYPETSQKLLSHILKLWRHQDEYMQLVSTSLNNFVFGSITKKVIETFLYKNHERMEEGKSPLHPKAHIDLYNEFINHLIRVVEDEELMKLEWPTFKMTHLEQAPPRSWNNSHIEMLGSILRHLKLPDIKLDDFTSHASLRKSLHEYAIKISNQDNSSIVLISHLDVLLRSSLMILKPVIVPDEDNSKWKIHILHWPWTEIIKACIYHKLTGLPDLAVYHQPKNLNSFSYPHSWRLACDTHDFLWSETCTNNQHSSRKRKPCYSTSSVVSQKKKPSKLLTDIAKEKRRCMDFERKLQNMLDDELDFSDD